MFSMIIFSLGENHLVNCRPYILFYILYIIIYFGYLMWRAHSGKDPDGGEDWGQKQKGTIEDEMVGWHHRLNGHEFEQTPGDKGSAGKESACDAGDPGSVPGLGRSPGEGIGYPLQYTWASLVAQMVKNLPAMRETWVWSLVGEDSPGGGHEQPTLVFLPGESPWTEEPGGLQSTGFQRVRHNWVTKYIAWR